MQILGDGSAATRDKRWSVKTRKCHAKKGRTGTCIRKMLSCNTILVYIISIVWLGKSEIFRICDFYVCTDDTLFVKPWRSW